MERDLEILTLLLQNPCLTLDEATREAAATASRARRASRPVPRTEPSESRHETDRTRWSSVSPETAV